MPKCPKLPSLLDRKLYKAGQTRGADNSVIYQNRVLRNNTVLVPYHLWNEISNPPPGETEFDNGFIALITPEDYFTRTTDIQKAMAAKNLKLGKNALVFYEKRADWDAHNPKTLGWRPASQRVAPLKGKYVARIAGTTSTGADNRIDRGFTSGNSKGAGIRLFEYAPSKVIERCKIQLEAVFWRCADSMDAVSSFGMDKKDACVRKKWCLDSAKKAKLLDYCKLKDARIINKKHETICPLCLKKLSGHGFFSRLRQAMGRDVHDLTVTEINLFHIKELRYGSYNHQPYNLGWGHHHCNVVVRDEGIDGTIKWMDTVVKKNITAGYYRKKN